MASKTVRTLLFAVLFAIMALPLRTMAEDVQDNGIAGISDDRPSITLRPTATTRERNWFERFFFKPDWAQARSECITPRDVCRMVEKHISYREDTVDLWASAKETWERGYGDCKDMAICVQTMCRELKFEVSVQLFYTLSPSLTGHAIATGESGDGSLWFSSNGSFEKVRSSKEIADRVAAFLLCDASRMWNVILSNAEVDKRVSSDASHNTLGAAPVAIGAK